MSPSSVKRWIDDGRVAATRTPGGHRRVSLAEAARYIREAGLGLEHPERLGLPDLTACGHRGSEAADAEGLYQALIGGDTAAASGMLQTRFLAGATVAQLVDGPLVEAMERAGALWRVGPDGILGEHRATETAVAALVRLRALLRPAPEAPLALGGAPADDPYLLATLSAAAVLEDEGFRAANLGPRTPLDTLALGAEALRPRLVWISVSVAAGAARLRREVLGLARRHRSLGAVLVVGGAEVDALDLGRERSVCVGRSMAELRMVARGLLLQGAAAG